MWYRTCTYGGLQVISTGTCNVHVLIYSPAKLDLPVRVNLPCTVIPLSYIYAQQRSIDLLKEKLPVATSKSNNQTEKRQRLCIFFSDLNKFQIFVTNWFSWDRHSIQILVLPLLISSSRLSSASTPHQRGTPDDEYHGTVLHGTLHEKLITFLCNIPPPQNKHLEV